MGWVEWLLRRLQRHTKRIVRTYKPEIKHVVIGIWNDGLDDLKKEFYEKASPPDFAKEPIESFVKYIKDNSDTYIEMKINQMLEGE